jgi:hypothetical protein
MTSFVDLAKGGKSFGDIKKLVDDVYGDKAFKKTQIYKILKQVKMGKNRRGFTKQKNKMTADLIASIAAAVEDRWVSIQDLARAMGRRMAPSVASCRASLGWERSQPGGSRSCCPHREGGPGVPGEKKRIKLLSHPPY